MKLKKGLMVGALVIGLITSGTAIKMLDMSVEPDKPRHNDSVDVVAYVDGEGTAISTVDVDVRKNGELIQNDVALSLVNGDNKNVAGYRAENVFQVNSTDIEDFKYDLTGQAIDRNGLESSYLLTVDVESNETIIDREDIDAETVGTFHGFAVIDLIGIGLIGIFAYTIIVEP